MMQLKHYLWKKHAPGTAKRYYRDILVFLEEMGQEKARAATYGDIMDYIGKLRKRYTNPETVKCTLHGIKKYYYWLAHSGQRKDNPCRSIRLRDKSSRDIQLQDLFTPGELEMLMERKERFRYARSRNQVVVSLLIYQGLRAGEIVNLALQDINLEEGTINIKPTAITNGRELKLKPRQIMLFHDYIHQVRPGLLKGGYDDGYLLLTGRGSKESGYVFKNLFKPFEKLFPGRILHAKTIRQSVIANLLKQGHDLRLVQTFAGHKYPGSTEKYRQKGIEELRAGIEKYHPLGG